jgi:hypothetical protein
MLTGEAKKKYQREYMRLKRAGGSNMGLTKGLTSSLLKGSLELKLAGGGGFEPPHAESESAVLPLD